MPTKPKSPATPTELRRRAERRMNEGQATPDFSADTDARRLLHELEVHQIELEMQNAELRIARDEAESVLEKYTELYDFAPAGYFTLSENGTILQTNLTGSSLVGIERVRLVGLSFAALVSPEYRHAFHIFLQHALEDPDTQAIDSKLSRDGQPPRPVNIKVQRSPDGQECRAVVMDITERKLAEDIRHRNQALFSALIEQAPVGLYVVDSTFRLQQANPAAMKLFNKIHPLIGRDFSEIIHILWPKRVADQAAARFRHTLKTGEPYHSPEFAERRRDIGVEEIYEWQIQRVTLPAGEFGVVCFFNNITERKRAEAAEQHLAVLTASNAKLSQEILQQQMVEDSLRKTKKDQARLLEQSRKHQQQLREISHQILQVQEEERKRISRELHDVIAQTLVGINVHLAALIQGNPETSKAFQQKIARTHQLVEKSVEIVHKFALELRPTVLDHLGLVPALHAHLIKFMADTGIRASLQAFAGIEKSPGPVRIMLYRVAQEALTNVARHAGANKVAVSIEKIKGGIRMEITDNGKGFTVGGPPNAKPVTRLGLIGMKERVEMIGGTFHVESAPGKSTTVRIQIKNPPIKRPKLPTVPSS